MAHGQNAEKNGINGTREYHSRRPGTWYAGWGRIYKIMTHRAERAAARREEHRAMKDAEA